MERIILYTITEQQENLCIIEFLKQQGFSRHILRSMKDFPGSILLNGSPSRGRALLRSGDSLRIFVPETDPWDKIPPVSVDLNVLYEDEDLLVLNKPAGMPVHPSAGNHGNTLANAAAAWFLHKGENCPFRCINRLDRDTSGALILAKNPLSASVLSSQMKTRQIRRTYLAVVRGIPPLQGNIAAPIGRTPGSLIERRIDFAGGESAVTHFKRLAVKNGHSLLEIHLETGRTHQIRVHMGYLGYPLPADYLYCPDYSRFSRQPLHSFQLNFRHPLTGKTLCITAPVPEDIRRAFLS